MQVDGRDVKRIMVAGGAGFIGSNFIRSVHRRFPAVDVLNYDKLTYAGNLENLEGIEGHYAFVQGDIRDAAAVEKALAGVDVLVNFAAETHVDRSIHDPGDFILTDVYGVFVLLEAVRRNGAVRRFVHVSTDEVYGSIAEGRFSEESPLNPSSPYSASKAGGDRLAYSYFRTFGLPVIIARPANNYGPYQYPEKLIPFFVTRALQDFPLPLYGDGSNRRDWLFVEDTVAGILALIEKGEPGLAYNLGADQERSNSEVTRLILEILGKPGSLVRAVADRRGHDFRYALDWERMKGLGWRPGVGFEEGLRRTVEWYLKHEGWWRRLVEKKAFRSHVRKNYE
ncbi:MAG: dTDP-glucose 4,6-dehydratase [Candidatus Aminicenantes bacterium]|nr:dTDP-glucose 4,6-dehydratase [Candidatus Aminicenantes bacterium]